ncbi:MAG: hypothetical protein JW863_04390 [Chitinispirillaceae bacterium]|nr:hypothetical protein [Chitinispirillaceae bacterium]
MNAGNGSSVGGGVISGLLFELGGDKPAEGSLIEVRRFNETALIRSGAGKSKDAEYTTLTDKNGRFVIKTLGEGLYVIEGSDGAGNMVRIDSVTAGTLMEPLELPPDTLMPAGFIRGEVELEDSGSFIECFVLVFGTDRFRQVDETGSFLFSELARGTYTLKIISVNNHYGPVDIDNILVKSGDTTDIGTITLSLRGSDKPELSVTYDTLTETATLSWDTIPSSQVQGYRVYQMQLQGGFGAASTQWLHTDLDRSTTTCRIEKPIPLMDNGEEIIPINAYYITAVDASGNDLFTTETVEVTFESYVHYVALFALKPFPAGDDYIRTYCNSNGELLVLSNRNDSIEGYCIGYIHYASDGTVLGEKTFTNCKKGSAMVFPVNWPLDETGALHYITDNSVYRVSEDDTCTLLGAIAAGESGVKGGFFDLHIHSQMLLLVSRDSLFQLLRFDTTSGKPVPWGETLFTESTIHAVAICNDRVAVHHTTGDVSLLSFCTAEETVVESVPYPEQVGQFITATGSILVGSDGYSFTGDDGTATFGTSVVWRDSIIGAADGGLVLLRRMPYLNRVVVYRIER